MEEIEHTVRLRRRKGGKWHVDEASLQGLDQEQLTALSGEGLALALKLYARRGEVGLMKLPDPQ